MGASREAAAPAAARLAAPQTEHTQPSRDEGVEARVDAGRAVRGGMGSSCERSARARKRTIAAVFDVRTGIEAAAAPAWPSSDMPSRTRGGDAERRCGDSVRDVARDAAGDAAKDGVGDTARVGTPEKTGQSGPKMFSRLFDCAGGGGG